MDVSAYFVNAATRQMAETEAIEDKFREVDALIDSVEEEGRLLGPPSDDETEPVTLTEEERRHVERVVGLVLGAADDDPSSGGAAA
ncbi:hypothetical protein EKD16_20185 [Streptomonospora litoralis]|uniref:Uncharacterized protein n=2 Tax=Streptomonospora litoralis TaxID=2498135 RepID=A0A4P6Q663_9ACTN|nr:hypothetical protein EKD16_20185 [Streptomonospora litoralis]